MRQSRSTFPGQPDDHLIAVDRFIQATRDSGYKGTTSAVSELVDNALQAGASQISISVNPDQNDEVSGLAVEIADNGCGMDGASLQQALRFGGSSRFNDRSGLGRYGMGLPNSSLSQARRLEVVTWKSQGRHGPATWILTKSLRERRSLFRRPNKCGFLKSRRSADIPPELPCDGFGVTDSTSVRHRPSLQSFVPPSVGFSGSSFGKESKSR